MAARTPMIAITSISSTNVKACCILKIFLLGLILPDALGRHRIGQIAIRRASRTRDRSGKNDKRDSFLSYLEFLDNSQIGRNQAWCGRFDAGGCPTS